LTHQIAEAPCFVGWNRFEITLLKFSEANSISDTFGKIAKTGNVLACLFCQNNTKLLQKRIFATDGTQNKGASEF
jgi:hypothetical protein